MMYKKLFLTAALIAACITTNAQTTASDYKGTSYNNPISASVFCADPTALDYNGRLYVYGTNDHSNSSRMARRTATAMETSSRSSFSRQTIW